MDNILRKKMTNTVYILEKNLRFQIIINKESDYIFRKCNNYKCNKILNNTDYINNTCTRCGYKFNLQDLLFCSKYSNLQIKALFNEQENNFTGILDEKFSLLILKRILNKDNNTNINEIDSEFLNKNNIQKNLFYRVLSNENIYTYSCKIYIYNNIHREQIILVKQNNNNSI